MWVLLSAFAAIVLIGPIGLATMHRVLSRLAGITQAMIRLSRHDTTTIIPSRDDRDEVGAMARAVEVFKDNAIQLIAREVELKQLNRRVDIALNNMTHGLCMFDAEQKLIVCNKTYVQMYALTPELSKPGTLLQAIENYRATIGNGAIANPEQMAAATAIHAREASAFTQELMDGRIVAVSQRPMQDGGWVAVHEDITERRRAEAKIAHLARHDMLTNLPNRVLFREHLENAFERIQPGRGFAVHCLDLDHFKTVNDTLGHPIGDELLEARGRPPDRGGAVHGFHRAHRRRRIRGRSDQCQPARAVQPARLPHRRDWSAGPMTSTAATSSSAPASASPSRRTTAPTPICC